MKDVKDLFVSHELAILALAKGFNQDCLAKFSQLSYPINDSGNDYKTTLCLYIPFENRYDEVKMLWIDNEDANFHWHEGTYTDGEHSRCELAGEDLNAPTYQQLVDWFREKYGIHIRVIRKYKFMIINDSKESEYYDDVQYDEYYKALNKGIENVFKLI